MEAAQLIAQVLFVKILEEGSRRGKRIGVAGWRLGCVGRQCFCILRQYLERHSLSPEQWQIITYVDEHSLGSA